MRCSMGLRVFEVALEVSYVDVFWARCTLKVLLLLKNSGYLCPVKQVNLRRNLSPPLGLPHPVIDT